MLTGAIFDLDGVIADSHPTHVKSWKNFLTSIGRNVTDDELEVLRDGRSKEDLLRHFMGDLTHEQLCSYSEEKDRIYRECLANLDSVPGVGNLLEQLKNAGIVLAVASSGSYWRVNYTLDLLGFRSYFCIISTANEFRHGKSDSTIFLETARRMRVRCEETLVFEDSPTAIRSAISIGMKCVGIADRSRVQALVEAGAERVSPDFAPISLMRLQSLFSAGEKHKSLSYVLD